MSLLAVTSGDIASGVVEPEGVEFDGVTDYLSKAGALGASSVKQLTLSCYIYNSGTNFTALVGHDNTLNNDFINVIHNSNNTLTIYLGGSDSGGSSAVSLVKANALAINTFNHVIISLDASLNIGSCYVNDISVPITVSNVNINVNQVDTWYISRTFSGIYGKGRLSNLYLDYTYRDLSIEANRRLFITADGKPTPTATLKALNPILYLPMKDASTSHINEGTGGNFVQNGTLDTASRGANQDNCKASYFDGVADYLSRTSLTGVADGKVFTLSLNVRLTLNSYVLSFGDGSTFSRLNLLFNGNMQITAYNSSGTGVLTVNCPYYTFMTDKNRLINLSISVDLTDINKCHVLFDNKIMSITKVLYTDDNIDFTVPQYCIGKISSGASYTNGNIGELYFDTRYTDLATSNPFWDVNTNRPKPVRQVIAETSITPLIAMPLDASNAGKNYGTGGDFTANSGPYVGARGGSEFWARSIATYVDSKYIKATNFITPTKQLTVVMAIKPTASYRNGFRALTNLTTYGYDEQFLYINDNGAVSCKFTNSSKSTVFYFDSSTYAVSGNWKILLVSIDLANSYRKAYVNNTALTMSGVVSVNDYIDFTGHTLTFGKGFTADGLSWQGDISICYLSNQYIDFSQEVNRNKFIDQLGYPKDLKAQIESGVIPKPLFYLPFDDPTNLGKDASGNNNHFTVNGTVTQGADVNG